MKKIVKIEKFDDVKKAKLLSAILLGLPEIDDLEFDLNEATLSISLNSILSNNILTYYIKSANIEVIDIKDEN
jgi:hypothetical protein